MALALETFHMLSEAAQKNIKKGEESRITKEKRVCCDTCGASCKDRESHTTHSKEAPRCKWIKIGDQSHYVIASRRRNAQGR